MIKQTINHRIKQDWKGMLSLPMKTIQIQSPTQCLHLWQILLWHSLHDSRQGFFTVYCMSSFSRHKDNKINMTELVCTMWSFCPRFCCFSLFYVCISVSWRCSNLHCSHCTSEFRSRCKISNIGGTTLSDSQTCKFDTSLNKMYNWLLDS